MNKKIIVVFALLFLFTIGGIVSYRLLSPSEVSEDGDNADNGSDQDSSFEPQIYGDGEVLVTFEVKVPEWTPEEDRIYLVADGYMPLIDNELSRGIPMQEKGEDIWVVGFLAPADEELTYKYNRNNLGFITDEEFEPDSEGARRSTIIASEPISISDEVNKWRWLTKEPPKADVSTFVPTVVPSRPDPFVIGIGLLDLYREGRFGFLAEPTFDRLEEENFEYVGISYAPSYIENTNPLEFSHEAINTYTEEQLVWTIREVKKRGLKVMLSAGIEYFSEVDAGLQETHSDDWYEQLVEEWENVMVETAELAEEEEVEIFVTSNQWPFWGNMTEAQRKIVDNLVNEAYGQIRNVYSGVITSDLYDGSFTFYKSMDWVGDKWWWEIADNKETSISEMKAGSEEIIENIYQPIYEEYEKPIFIHQLAYGSYDGAAGGGQVNTEGPEVSESFPYNSEYPFDFQEQADAYEAVFQAIYDEPMFAGVFSFSYVYWDSYDKSTGIRGKPAENVWVKWNSIFNQ